jgi:cyanophycinase
MINRNRNAGRTRTRRLITTILLLAIGFGGVGVLLMGAYCAVSAIGVREMSDDIVGPKAGGALIICGGGSIPDEARKRFLEWAGGPEARIVVIPAFYASADDPKLVRHLETWRKEGAAQVQPLCLDSRADSDSDATAELLADATGVWISGGDQSVLSENCVGTEVERQLKALLDRGGAIGGTSAGAAIMTRVMIASGREDAAVEHGFDLLPGSVIDQHFLRRNRVQRLLTVLSQHPDLVGFGIDERTALQVRTRDLWLNVLGESYVVTCMLNKDGKTPRIQILKRGDRANFETLKDPSLWVTSTADVDAMLSAHADQ